MGAVLLAIGVLSLSATLGWGASYLPSDSDAGKAVSRLVTGIVESLGAYYTLLMFALYLPALLLQARALLTPTTGQDQRSFMKTSHRLLILSAARRRAIVRAAALLLIGGPLLLSCFSMQAVAQEPSSADAIARPAPPVCETFNGGPQANGVVWCGDGPTLDFQELAERAAPILWFAPQEPLLDQRHLNLPEPLPCEPPDQLGKQDEGKQGAVVYYQISRIIRGAKSGEEETFKGKSLKLDAIQSVIVKYYFYYSEDIGFEGHVNDIENTLFEIKIEKEKTGSRYRARIVEVIGAAHGVHWFENRHVVDKKTVFPITIMVEQGKHASCPDKDGDGEYQPGLDVNKRINDAWGVCDKFGKENKWLPIRPYYRPWMSEGRGRNPEDRVGALVQTNKQADIFAAYKGPKGVPRRFYHLLEFHDCPQIAASALKRGKKSTLNIAAALKRRRAGLAPLSEKSDFSLADVLFGKEANDEWSENRWERAPISYRYDGAHGFAFNPYLSMPFYKGYVLPKIAIAGFSNETRRYSIEQYYTPSAARWWDWYVSAGFEWTKLSDTFKGYRHKFVTEAGLRFRFAKGKTFFGFRVGLRSSSFKHPRLAIEPGGGLF